MAAAQELIGRATSELERCVDGPVVAAPRNEGGERTAPSKASAWPP